MWIRSSGLGSNSLEILYESCSLTPRTPWTKIVLQKWPRNKDRNKANDHVSLEVDCPLFQIQLNCEFHAIMRNAHIRKYDILRYYCCGCCSFMIFFAVFFCILHMIKRDKCDTSLWLSFYAWFIHSFASRLCLIWKKITRRLNWIRK